MACRIGMDRLQRPCDRRIRQAAKPAGDLRPATELAAKGLHEEQADHVVTRGSRAGQIATPFGVELGDQPSHRRCGGLLGIDQQQARQQRQQQVRLGVLEAHAPAEDLCFRSRSYLATSGIILEHQQCIDRLQCRVAGQYEGCGRYHEAITGRQLPGGAFSQNPAGAGANDVELDVRGREPQRPCASSGEADGACRARLHQTKHIGQGVCRRFLDDHDMISDE